MSDAGKLPASGYGLECIKQYLMKNKKSRRNFLKVSSTAVLGTMVGCSYSPSTKGDMKATGLATIYNTEEFLLSGPANRTFRIQISHPHADDPSVELMKKGVKPIPVYVIDGGYAFGMISNIARYLQWGGLNPIMVIGIAYENQMAAGELYRMHDLTPPDKNFSSRYDDTLGPESVGGAPDFREFLIGILKPLIENKYNVDAFKSILFGHSFGGLFALNAMLKSPNSFNGILALSPSIWFKQHQLLKTLNNGLENDFRFTGKLAVYVGGKEEEIAGEKYKMTSNVEELKAIVLEHSSSFVDYDIKILPDRTHHNILGQGVTEGLEFLLS